MRKRLCLGVCGVLLAVAGCGGGTDASGHGILFVRVRPHASVSQLYVWQPGTGARPVGPAGNWEDSAAWSPDGKSIAFSGQQGSWDQANPEDVYVMDAGGSGVKRLTDSGGPIDWYGAPSWSPDGSQIVSSHGYHPTLSILQVPSGAERAVHFGGYEPVWGKRGIAYTSGSSPNKLMLLDPVTGRSRVLVSKPGRVLDVSWSRSGRLAVLGGEGDRPAVAIYSSEGRRTASFALPTSGGRACALAWSPDGARLAVAGYGGAWTVSATGKHWRRLPIRASGCSVSWR